MALTNFVPTFWSRLLDISLRETFVAESLVNRDYEGEIKQAGDKVKITRPSAISVGDYTVGSDITIETPTSTQKTLTIDQQKYIAFEIDDVRRAQANIELRRPYMEEATYALSDTVDTHLFGHYSNVDASNVITKEVLTASNIFAKIAEAAENFDTNNVPSVGRWMVLSPAIVTFLRTSSQFTAASELGDDVKKSGLVGQVLGFDIFMSNNLTTANDGSNNVLHCLYGHRSAITFAMQFQNMETQRMEKRFSDLVKGLLLYGSLTVKPKALGDLRHTVS